MGDGVLKPLKRNFEIQAQTELIPPVEPVYHEPLNVHQSVPMWKSEVPICNIFSCLDFGTQPKRFEVAPSRVRLNQQFPY